MNDLLSHWWLTGMAGLGLLLFPQLNWKHYLGRGTPGDLWSGLEAILLLVSDMDGWIRNLHISCLLQTKWQ